MREVPRNGRESNAGASRRERLYLAMDKLSSKALSKGKKKTYKQGVQAYMKFLSYIKDDQKYASPPDSYRLMLFTAYLAYYRRLFYRSIHTYVYSVRSWVMKEGYHDPMKPRSSRCRFKLLRLLAGVKRVNKRKTQYKETFEESACCKNSEKTRGHALVGPRL